MRLGVLAGGAGPGLADLIGQVPPPPGSTAPGSPSSSPGTPLAVVAGDERTVEQAVRAYADAGATELVASLTGDDADRARTRDFLAGLCGIRP